MTSMMRISSFGLGQAVSYDFLPQPSLALFYDKAVGWLISPNPSIRVWLYVVIIFWLGERNGLS